MNGKGKSLEQERRDWIIILIILLFGFLCVIIAGEQAVRLSPNWKLDTNMRSNLDPDSDFLTDKPVSYYEPLDPSILTLPAWFDVLLTPGAVIETRTPNPSANITNTPVGTNTLVPTAVNSPTAVNPVTNTPTLVLPSPTNTFIYYPPATATKTSPPPNTVPPPTTSVPPTVTPITVTPPTAIPVDLGITKTDNSNTYTAGSTVTYTITVINNSSNPVTGATISDGKPAQVTTWGWCAGTCTPTTFNSANINITFNLGASASATYTVLANIDPAATNSLTNTATVGVPSGYTDTNGANDSASDTDTLATFTADLSITKTDGITLYTPGGAISYTIDITNLGPDNASGFGFSDNVPASITGLSVNCSTSGTANCGTNNTTGNAVSFSGASINAGAGNTITITVSGTVAIGTTGPLSNTADIIIPGSATFSDPDTSNNTATDIDTQINPPIDLSITKSDESPTYSPGDTLTYTIIVSNPLASGATATGFNITDTVPLLMNTLTVSCTPSSGSDSCGTNGTSGLNVAYNGATLSAGQTLTITITGRVALWQSGNLNNTANIVIPGGAPFTDPNTGNNASTDSDTATTPSCDTTINISGAGNFLITNGQVTCLLFTDPTLTQGAIVDISNSGTTYLRWMGLPEGGSGACDLEQGLLWMFDSNLLGISVDRDIEIILYVQALFGGDTLTISYTDWTTGCP